MQVIRNILPRTPSRPKSWLTCALLLFISPLSQSFPIYLEGTVRDIEQTGEVQDAWGINTGWLQQGGLVQLEIEVEESRLQAMLDSGLARTSNDQNIRFREPTIGAPNGFLSSAITDSSDASFDVLSYATADSTFGSQFSLTDSSIEGFNFAQAKRYELSVFAETLLPIITSLDYNELGFELFEADIFDAELYFDTAYFLQNPGYHELQINLDLSYLRVGNAEKLARKVSAPPSTLLILGGLLSVWLTRWKQVHNR